MIHGKRSFRAALRGREVGYLSGPVRGGSDRRRQPDEKEVSEGRLGVDGQRQRWRRRIVVFRIRTCNHVAAMRYVLIMSTATESLSDDQDVRELVEAIDAGEIGTGLVGGAGDGAGREIAPICRRDPRTRPTIVVRNKDMEQFYFEAGSEGRIWLPWEILPERASQRLVRLVSESGRKNIYYERCDEAQIAMPPGLTQEVTEGGLFQWAGGSRPEWRYVRDRCSPRFERPR